MSGSSILVAVNALLLTRLRLPQGAPPVTDGKGIKPVPAASPGQPEEHHGDERVRPAA